MRQSNEEQITKCNTHRIHLGDFFGMQIAITNKYMYAYFLVVIRDEFNIVEASKIGHIVWWCKFRFQVKHSVALWCSCCNITAHLCSDTVESTFAALNLFV